MLKKQASLVLEELGDPVVEAADLGIPGIAQFSATMKRAVGQICASTDALIAAGKLPELKERWENASPAEKLAIIAAIVEAEAANLGS